MKKSVYTLKQYDYTSQAEFKKHSQEMKEKGYRLLTDEFNSMFNNQEIIGDEKWHYTACYCKDTL